MTDTNITITNNDLGNPIIELTAAEDGLLEFAGADTFVEGTILARNTSNDKFQPFAKGGVSNGNGIPVAILTHETTNTGAGDIAVRVAVTCKVIKQRLVIDADGDDANIDGGVRDQLRNASIWPIDTTQLAQLDNQ